MHKRLTNLVSLFYHVKIRSYWHRRRLDDLSMVNKADQVSYPLPSY
ncbi:hypothetical protein [Melghiribacillus thermohalophilus]|nr:hypothetical protein [Melghiribacillus thermohalophilus]